MAQHDYNILNASFPTVRADINNVLSAINSSNSGSSRPSGAVAGTIWLDTSGNATAQLLKLYDGAADILLGTINFTANTVNWADSDVASEVSLTGTETLTNKTLTSPKINENVAVTSTATELNKLDAVSRGSIIYGNASAVTSILTKGGANTVLTSDGTDISWASASGRTGTVSWDTTVKTSSFTGANGVGYFCNTAGGAFTLTLPSSPSAGDIVGFKDYNGNFATASLTIGRGGKPINGANNADPKINSDGASIFLVYVNGTQGWVATQDDTSTFSGASFICASVSGSGNTITDDGNFKVATFTGPGTFTVNSVSSTSANNQVSYSVSAGGGGGGTNTGSHSGGGGGAGGFRETKSPATPYTASPLDGYGTPANRITVSAQGYPIAIGGGGSAATSASDQGNNGSNSTVFGLTSNGGGGGGSPSGSPNYPGLPGGSGGGGASEGDGPGGSGNTPPTTPAQGTGGGTGTNSPPDLRAGGGGGATADGDGGVGGARSGNGGAGATTSINGSSTSFSGGGGGGRAGPSGQQVAGTATGGGGAGGANAGTAGTVNTGGGGGGGGYPCGAGGAGGSGIVIIRYRAGN